MNIINFYPFQKTLSFLLTKGKISFLSKLYWIFPKNWTDEKGNNFYHYAAMHQNAYLYEFAQFNNADINQLNESGLSPLHKCIEAYFVIEDSKIIFDFDKQTINKLIQDGADVNLRIQNKARDGEWGQSVALYSKTNHMGSPIELLMQTFWTNIVDKITFKNEFLEQYNEAYDILSKAGAEINLIKEAGTFSDIGEHHPFDAMQTTDKFIVSHMFAKYIVNTKDLYIILPILKDPRLDFSLKDQADSNILHIVFGRIATGFHRLNYNVIEELMVAILTNPSVKVEDFDHVNYNKISAIDCLKKDSSIFKKMIINYFLKERLTQKLDNVEDKPIRKKVIKI